MKCDIITIGGAVEDIAFYTKEGILIDNKQDILKQKLLAFEYGAKIKIDKTYSSCGGGAVNTSINFSRLGFKTAVLATIGNDSRGKKVIENLNKHKVNIKLLQTIKNKETGFSLILVNRDNEHIAFLNRGANDQLTINNYELRILEKAKWIYLTSLSGKWQDVLNKIFSIKENKTLRIAWNPGNIQFQAGSKVLKKYLEKTNVLILNKDEALELCAETEASVSVFSLLKTLKELGPETIVITNGKNGAYAYDNKKYYFQKSVKVKKQINTIGVGDVFGSSFVAGLELYNNIKKAMQLAVKNASLAVGKHIN